MRCRRELPSLKGTWKSLANLRETGDLSPRTVPAPSGPSYPRRGVRPRLDHLFGQNS
jgi:hypothetical protein